MNYFITGGGCIVENSTFGLNRKTAFLKRLSQETGVHIVAGTGIDLFVSSKSRNSLTDSIFETGAYEVPSKSQNLTDLDQGCPSSTPQNSRFILIFFFKKSIHL